MCASSFTAGGKNGSWALIFVALQYRDGTFTGYNTYRNSTGPDPYGESLEAFLKKKHYFGAFLIGIRKKA